MLRPQIAEIAVNDQSRDVVHHCQISFIKCGLYLSWLVLSMLQAELSEGQGCALKVPHIGFILEIACSERWGQGTSTCLTDSDASVRVGSQSDANVHLRLWKLSCL